MFPDPNGPDRINSYALVSYIPEPLSGFLNRLRQELVPNCFLRAHITILPPRPITSNPKIAFDQMCEAASRFRPFDCELASIEVFPVSDVIHISVGEGEPQLREMHAALNIGGLKYQEPFKYHPHVTLAQELKSDQLDELHRVAKRRWAEFKFGHVFHIESMVFVQSSRRKNWIDLAECKLGYSGSLQSRIFHADGQPVMHGR